MKKLLILILLVLSSGIAKAQYTFQKNDCRLEVIRQSQIRHSFLLEDLRWVDRAGDAISVFDGVMTLNINGFEIDNYTGGQVDSLMAQLETWRLQCLTRVSGDTLFIGSDTILTGAGGAVNFANTNLTLDATREHELLGFDMTLDGDSADLKIGTRTFTFGPPLNATITNNGAFFERNVAGERIKAGYGVSRDGAGLISAGASVVDTVANRVYNIEASSTYAYMTFDDIDDGKTNRIQLVNEGAQGIINFLQNDTLILRASDDSVHWDIGLRNWVTDAKTFEVTVPTNQGSLLINKTWIGLVPNAWGMFIGDNTPGTLQNGLIFGDATAVGFADNTYIAGVLDFDTREATWQGEYDVATNTATGSITVTHSNPATTATLNAFVTNDTGKVEINIVGTGSGGTDPAIVNLAAKTDTSLANPLVSMQSILTGVGAYTNKLSISGDDILFIGDNVTGADFYTMPLTRGTNGQVLITDGTGQVTWQTGNDGVYSGSGFLTDANTQVDGNNTDSLTFQDIVRLTFSADTINIAPVTGLLINDGSDYGSAFQEIRSDGRQATWQTPLDHTRQTATGDGTTTIVWDSGSNFDFTFGAFNETFTFTAPTNPGILTLTLLQDGVGSRTATWPGTVQWPGGTAPTLTTTATTGKDLIQFYYDGTNYLQVSVTLDLQ